MGMSCDSLVFFGFCVRAAKVYETFSKIYPDEYSYNEDEFNLYSNATQRDLKDMVKRFNNHYAEQFAHIDLKPNMCFEGYDQDIDSFIIYTDKILCSRLDLAQMQKIEQDKNYSIPLTRAIELFDLTKDQIGWHQTFVHYT